MTITLYVNWEAQELYKNEKELVEGYFSWHGGEDACFNEYLSEVYELDTLFYATEGKKKEILEKYKADMLENAKDWAIDFDMITTIEV